MAPNPDTSLRPCLFVSEWEIPPWMDRVCIPITPPGRMETLRSPGFRVSHGVLSSHEIQTLHDRLRHLYIEAMTEWKQGFTGHRTAISATRIAWTVYLKYMMKEEHMTEFLEEEGCVVVRDFTKDLLCKLQRGRMGADPTVQKMASLLLKAFFVAPAEWE